MKVAPVVGAATTPLDSGLEDASNYVLQRAQRIQAYRTAITAALVAFERDIYKGCINVNKLYSWGELPEPLRTAFLQAILSCGQDLKLDEVNEGLRQVFPNLRVPAQDLQLTATPSLAGSTRAQEFAATLP